MVRQRAPAAVEQISTALGELQVIMADPAEVDFDSVADSFELLEKAVASKAKLDAAFAWLADRSRAGERVGTVRTMDYLVRRLGLSQREALARLRTGESLFTPPVPPSPPPPDPDETDNQRRQREEEEQRQREETRRRQQEQEKSRDQADQIPAEKLAIIEQELRQLNDTSRPPREELYHQALMQALTRTPEDLRVWLRHRVVVANRNGARDLTAAHRKRFLHLSAPDSDGGRRISGYLAGAEAEQLEAALSLGDRAGSNLPDDLSPDLDTRTRTQRRADQLSALITASLTTHQAASRHGVGSILLSLTAEDVAGLDTKSTFATNTGGELNVYDLLRLGAAQFDVLVLHDRDGQPLALGRGRRTASFYQRVALTAAQAACGCPDCTTAAHRLEAHHLIPWDRGGTTDIDNLTLVCLPTTVTTMTPTPGPAIGGGSCAARSPGASGGGPAQANRSPSTRPIPRSGPTVRASGRGGQTRPETTIGRG